MHIASDLISQNLSLRKSVKDLEHKLVCSDSEYWA